MKHAYGLAMILVLMIASGAVVLGQSAKKAGQEDVATTVGILDHVWLDAAHNRDIETMSWLFADNFVEIHPGGDVVNKQQQLDQIADTQRPSLDIHPDDIQVRYASADVAVLTDTTIIHGSSGGVNYDGRQRVMRVFVKQNGRWRAAGAGLATISAP